MDWSLEEYIAVLCKRKDPFPLEDVQYAACLLRESSQAMVSAPTDNPMRQAFLSATPNIRAVLDCVAMKDSRIARLLKGIYGTAFPEKELVIQPITDGSDRSQQEMVFQCLRTGDHVRFEGQRLTIQAVESYAILFQEPGVEYLWWAKGGTITRLEGTSFDALWSKQPYEMTEQEYSLIPQAVPQPVGAYPEWDSRIERQTLYATCPYYPDMVLKYQQGTWLHLVPYGQMLSAAVEAGQIEIEQARSMYEQGEQARQVRLKQLFGIA